MKKLLSGVFAVALAVGAVAFTTKPAKFVDYYFPTDVSGTPQATSVLYTSNQSAWGCTGTIDNCSKSYTSYSFDQQTQLYSPAGTIVNTYLKD